MSPNMRVWSLTGILLVSYVCRTNGVPITYDFTDPLNAIKAGNLSVDEFSNNIKSHFGNLTTPRKLSVAYSPDCNIVVDCSFAVTVAVKILHDVKKNLFMSKIDIEHFSFRHRIDIKTLKGLDKLSMNQTKLHIPAGAHDISLILSENTTCDDLKSVTWKQWDILLKYSTWVSPDSVPNVRYLGFGYYEDLIGCEELSPARHATTNFLLTTFRLEKTSCVVESFEFFKKRMDDLNARNVKLMALYNDISMIDYSSTTHCLDDEYYLHLMENNWERYTNNKIVATIPMPIGLYEIPSYSANKIIPYIDAESCDGEISSPSYSPAALEILSRNFGTAVLTHVQWKRLQSNATRSATNGNPSNIQLDLLIDYSDWLQYNPVKRNFIGHDYNRSNVERELNELDDAILHPLENVKVTTLFSSISTNPTAENFTVNVNTGLVRRLSSRLRIGCGFRPTSFGTLFNYTSSAVVAACKQVNGSLYTLQYEFKLKSITKKKKENGQHFENIVWPKLKKMRTFRDKILVSHPQATVYFQLRIELQMDDNQTTVFCNNEALSLNGYIETTANWATFNRIPLIVGRAFDDNCHSKYQSWFSVVRPALRDLKYSNPRFVLRNYPQILADADVEPCLEWMVHRPTVTESFFYNNYLGSTFSTFLMREGKPISLGEYETLLQLIFHRFDMLEIVVTIDNYENIITAINKLASEGLIGSTKKVFIFYFDTRHDVDGEEKLRDFYGFLNFTKVTLGTKISLLKASFFGRTELVGERNIFSTELRHNTMAVKFGQSLSLDVGVQLFIVVCQNIIMNATSRKHVSKEVDNLLQTSTYLLCSESVDLDENVNPKNLGALFDTHFYSKKAFQEFYPHLNVFFKVNVRAVLTETTMTDYLILLSHFQKFAATYNLSYLIVNAFSPEYEVHSNGWWTISNYSNLSLTSIYEEKYSAIAGFKTWVPPLHIKPNQTTNTTNNNKLYIIVAALTTGLVITIVVLALVLWYFKNKNPQYLSNQEEREFYNGKEGTSEELTSGDSEYRKFDKKFELAFADVFIDPKDLLGRGNYGTVYKGLVKDEPVAIKRPNESGPATSFKSVLLEIKLLCYIGTHPNVIQFVGAYTKDIRKGILYIATKLCLNGSLYGLLRAKKRVISNIGEGINQTIGTEDDDSIYSHDLHRFAKEIASGMDYIAGKNVIHGDLAARNVLLDQNFTCKIGDFGLSRKLYEYQQYVKQSQEPLPWKWMAYESLKNMQFTTKSDVWSYGVAIWEIYSLGSVPYGGLSWTTGFADDLKNGLRLQMPEYTTDEIYKAMLGCWQLEDDERPTFTDMVDFFKELSSSQYIVLDI